MNRQLQEAIERVVARDMPRAEAWLGVAALERRDYMPGDHLGIVRMLSGIRQTAGAFNASRIDDRRAYDV